jgi:hypothetical protein
MNRRMPNGTYGGVRGWGREAPAYSIHPAKAIWRPGSRPMARILMYNRVHSGADRTRFRAMHQNALRPRQADRG